MNKERELTCTEQQDYYIFNNEILNEFFAKLLANSRTNKEGQDHGIVNK